MNEQTEGLASSTPSNVPMKRKRGRPRKVVTGVQGTDMPKAQRTNMPVMSGSSSKLNSNQTVRTANNCDHGMLGKEVAGVIEGTFNGGYLINVQVAADTYLRGVVFLPERVVPVTAENDVATQVRMIERTQIPIPVLNPQTQIHSSVQQGETLHEVDASRPAKESSADGGATKDSQKTSEHINLVPTFDNTEKELTTGQQSMPSVYKPNEFIPDEPKRSIIETNQIPVSAERESMPSEHINITVDNFMQKQVSPEPGTQEDTKTKLVIETLTKVDTENSNGRPSTHIAYIPDVGSNHALKFSHPSILYDTEAVPSESKFLSEGSHFQMSDLQNCSSFVAVNNVDAIQTTEVLVTSLESENQIGSDAS